MILETVVDICKRKYKDYKIYLHNFAKFDGYLLLKHLAQLGFFDPVVHKGRIIKCGFTLYETGITVTFMDSYLLLTSSLRKLCKSFSVKTTKSFFPFLLQDINYKGIVPDINLFNGINTEEFENYLIEFKDKIWNFKEESVKYCNLDCISLFEILEKFSQIIFNKFQLNITKYPTLPSLAFAIFKTHYL